MIQMNPLFLLLGETHESRGILNLDLQNFLDAGPNLFNFVLTVVLLTWLLYKPVKKVLQARADRVESDMNDAALSKKSAGELKEMYEQKVRDIESERAAILEEARRLATERRNEMLETAKADADAVKARADKDIATEKEQVKSAVHQAIIDISADMAAKLIGATIDKKAHDKLFSEAMAELEATTAFRTDAA
jgi:F-type H+-transporting ATPase subunit b